MSFVSDLHSNEKSCLTQRKKGIQVQPSNQEKSRRQNVCSRRGNMVPKILVVSGGYDYEPVNTSVDDENEVLTQRATDTTSNGTMFLNKDDSHCTENGLLLNEDHTKIIDFEPEEKDAGKLNETSFTIASQVVIPFLIAGLGTVAAGLLLDKVQVYVQKMVQVFRLFIINSLVYLTFSKQELECSENIQTYVTNE